MAQNKTLEQLVCKVNESKENFYKITVIENGKSETAVINQANGAQNSYSVAKAYTVAAIGMLYDEKLLTVDEKVCDIFKDELVEGMDPLWDEMTVHHLLKHTAGFECGYLDIDVADHTSIAGDDYLKYLFKSKLKFKPGTEFRYSDAAFYVLSRIVSKKTGRMMDELLLEKLFYPLGFREMAWSRCPKGYPMGATGLYVYTEDLAKLGVVYSNKGLYNGKRILSEEWVDLVLKKGYEFSKTEGGGYAKGGAYGQMLIFYPEKNRSIAYHSFGGGDLIPFIDSLE